MLILNLPSTFKKLQMTAELLTVLRLLEKEGVRALAVKGPVLAVQIQGGLNARRFDDLDLLLDPKDFSRAKEFLLGQGYRDLCPLSPARKKAAQSNADVLVHSEHGTVLDLHQELLPSILSLPLSFEELWDHSVTVDLGGEGVRTLSPEDGLLFLCVHGSKHLWERVGWARDVAGLIRSSPGLDWTRMLREADRLGCRRMLRLGLLLARDLAGAQLQEKINRSIDADQAAVSLAEAMKRRIREGRSGPFGFTETWPYYLRMRERTRDRVRDTIRHSLRLLVPTPEEWVRWPLTDLLFPLYYLIRPVRLMGKYLCKVFARR